MGKTNKNKKKNNNKTKKTLKKNIIIPNHNAKLINEISVIINKETKNQLPNQIKTIDNTKIESSYSPTVNRDLIMLQSIPREKMEDCNNDKAFQLKEPLQINIPGKYFGYNCVPYFDKKAIKFLLKNLSANKHVNIEKIVPPIQSQSNCWFNTMFVSLFVSDKGRKFFHFFRQLMIEGSQSNSDQIPIQLRNAFALLNYSIDACLSGNKFAYLLDTNSIIQNIYENIPESYKKKLPYITNINEAGNPIRYYGSIIYYLHNKSIQLAFIKNTNKNWKEQTSQEIKSLPHLPHVIILEIYDRESNKTINKPRSFNLNGAKYSLDSCIIRDTTQQHFCCILTCENKEMAYDGMSFHRLVPLDWKKYINSDFVWGFEGSLNSDNTPLLWNFKQGYQMLIYYRVK